MNEWQAHDLIPGRAYESRNFGTVQYLGLDHYCGETTHCFEVGRMARRYFKTENLGNFLKPRVNAEEEYERNENLCTEAAMAQWEKSLKRPDLQEKDRVRGAIEAYKRQAFALRMRPKQEGNEDDQGST
jgi:hypothetical protein